jgi:hypothetical protein
MSNFGKVVRRDDLDQAAGATERFVHDDPRFASCDIPIVTELQPLNPSDLASWSHFLSTVRVSGALPVTFRTDGDHVVIEVVVPYVPPEMPEVRNIPGPHKIPLLIAEGFPVPLTARFKLPAYNPENAANFVRHLVREIYLHEVDEQLCIGGCRPFTPKH